MKYSTVHSVVVLHLVVNSALQHSPCCATINILTFQQCSVVIWFHGSVDICTCPCRGSRFNATPIRPAGNCTTEHHQRSGRAGRFDAHHVFRQLPWDDLGRSYNLDHNLMHARVLSFSFKGSTTRSRSCGRRGSARTELKMWCAIVVYKSVKHQHRESDMNRQSVLCVLYRMCGEGSLSQVWNGRSDRQYVLRCHSTRSLGDWSDNQNMYVQSVRVDEWAQGSMRSMVHGGM